MGKYAVFIKNKYYTDEGMDYAFECLKREFASRGVTLTLCESAYASFPFEKPDGDFVLFWDKDIILARRLEGAGMRLFNSADAVEKCDDKIKTFEAVCGKTELPATVCAPLVYDVSNGEDPRFIDCVQSALGYPVVVKENTGSQGRQVYLAHDRRELEALHGKLIHTPHLFQRFIRGENAGEDVRVYIAGKRAVAAVKRTNTTDFRSNVSMGGEMTRIELEKSLASRAEQIAEALGLEYGSADFIPENGKYEFIEANSSAYMRTPERLGINLASLFADYVTEIVYGAR